METLEAEEDITGEEAPEPCVEEVAVDMSENV